MPVEPVFSLGIGGVRAHSGHGLASAMRLGSLTRVWAAAVDSNIQPTRPMPLWRVLRGKPVVLIQPKLSSIAFADAPADCVAGVARGPAIDGCAAPFPGLGRVIVAGDARGDPALARRLDEGRRIIGP